MESKKSSPTSCVLVPHVPRKRGNLKARRTRPTYVSICTNFRATPAPRFWTFGCIDRPSSRPSAIPLPPPVTLSVYKSMSPFHIETTPCSPRLASGATPLSTPAVPFAVQSLYPPPSTLLSLSLSFCFVLPRNPFLFLPLSPFVPGVRQITRGGERIFILEESRVEISLFFQLLWKN